jgi:hypothetical protein
MNYEKFNKMMDMVKATDKARRVKMEHELLPKFVNAFEQLRVICEYEKKQRHCKDKVFEFQFKCSLCGKKIVSMTVGVKDAEISINYKVNGEDDVRTIRSSDTNNKSCVDMDEDIEWMDGVISDYFAAKENGDI